MLKQMVDLKPMRSVTFNVLTLGTAVPFLGQFEVRICRYSNFPFVTGRSRVRIRTLNLEIATDILHVNDGLASNCGRIVM